MPPFIPNKGKKLIIKTDEGYFARYPVKTHVVMSGDSLPEIMETYLTEHLRQDDRIFISEKIVAISQGRAFPMNEIKPSRMAKFLTRFVYKSPYGIGLSIPETMELAIREVGRLKILFAAFCSAVTKPFGLRGVFYKICGPKARAVDGPCDYTLPPYNHYAKMAPDRPYEVAERLAEQTGCPVVVIDANDLGVEVLGHSKGITIPLAKQIFADNPLAQTDEQTPLAIVRPVTGEDVQTLEEETQKLAEKYYADREAAARAEKAKQAPAPAGDNPGGEEDESLWVMPDAEP